MQKKIEQCLKVLHSGGTILYPCDTIWGIGCDATNNEAVEKIYKIKNRDENKTMLILLDCTEKLKDYLDFVPELAIEMMNKATVPLTIIYPEARNIAGSLIAEDGSIGIRITREKFTNELIRQFGKPLVSTSANKQGKTYPCNFSDIDTDIIRLVDYTVNFRQDEQTINKPSRIIRIGKTGTVEIIRE